MRRFRSHPGEIPAMATLKQTGPPSASASAVTSIEKATNFRTAKNGAAP